MTTTDYAGTGRSFSELNELPRHERNAILARTLFELDRMLEPLHESRRQITNWLQSDLAHEGGSVIDTGDYEVTLEESYRWEYLDEEGFLQLLAVGVTQDQYDRAIQRSIKVNKAELNKLKKLGSRIESIINENCHKVFTGSKITVSRKKTSVVAP